MIEIIQLESHSELVLEALVLEWMVISENVVFFPTGHPSHDFHASIDSMSENLHFFCKKGDLFPHFLKDFRDEIIGGVQKDSCCFFKSFGDGEDFGSSFSLFILYFFLHPIYNFIMQTGKLILQIFSGLIVIKRICIFPFHDRLSPLIVFTFLLILNNHCKKHIRIDNSQAFPSPHKNLIQGLVQQKSYIPHPDHAGYVHSLVLCYEHLLVLVEFALFSEHHLELFLVDLDRLLTELDAFEGLGEFLKEVLRGNDDYVVLVLFYGLRVKVQNFVYEGILGPFVVPTICLSSQLLLDKSNEEVVEIIFSGLLEEVEPEGCKELAQKGRVVWYYIDCTIQWVLVILESFSYEVYQGGIVSL